MRKIAAVFTKELISYFVSPVAYVVLTVFLALSGYFFVNILFYTKEASLRYLLGNMSVTFLFVTPLLTMRLFAEEKRTNTMELLVTSPLRDFEMVLGKYFASLFIVLMMLSATLIYPICLSIYGDPDWGPILAGYLGVFLLAASFLSIGTMSSIFTKNQIVAALISFCLLLLYWTLGWLADQAPKAMELFLDYLALGSHQADFQKGIIDTRHLVYYFTVISFHLTVGILTLESQRWRE